MANRSGANKVVKLDWDLSQGHEITAIDWPQKEESEYYDQEGDFDLTLRLSEQRTFHKTVRLISCQRNDNLIYTIKAQGEFETLDSVYQNAQALIKDWQLPAKDIEKWYQDTKAGKTDRVFETMRNDLTPAPAMRLLHSYDDDLPYYLAFELAW